MLEKDKLTASEKATLLSRPLEETNKLIDELDLRLIKAKLCALSKSKDRGFNWPESDADMVIRAYRGYLKIVAKSHYQDFKEGRQREMVSIQSPDKDVAAFVVDIVWHTHILFTRKYLADCRAIFGYYLHHTPTISLEQEVTVADSESVEV
jgi:hypothetical protein